MPTWTQLLVVIVLLALVGFALVIVSGFWHCIALLLAFATLIVWLWRRPGRR